MHLLLNIHRLSRMAACIVQPLSIYNTKLFNLDIRNKFLISIMETTSPGLVELLSLEVFET